MGIVITRQSYLRYSPFPHILFFAHIRVIFQEVNHLPVFGPSDDYFSSSIFIFLPNAASLIIATALVL